MGVLIYTRKEVAFLSRKNHQWVDHQLLQMDKQYKNLKQKQREKISIWINEEIRSFYKEKKVLPRKPEQFIEVVDKLYQRIEEAGIWIPYDEVYKRFFGSRNGRIDKVYGQIIKEERSLSKQETRIESLAYTFAVCKLEDYSKVDLSSSFCFIQKTEEENSFICLSNQIPSNAIEVKEDWRAFRIQEKMKFSMIGIYTGIAQVLANKAISIMAMSTFQSDYIFVQKQDFEKAKEVLEKAGYTMQKEKCETLNYYNQNALNYAKATLAVDFTTCQEIFLCYLKPEAHILDFGCGAGRDSKAFLELGYKVSAIDGSEELCKIAREYTGIPIQKMDFQDLDATNEYDGIWACASILHVNKDELPSVFSKMEKALKPEGIIYASFKYGEFEGVREDRYYTDFTEETFMKWINKVSNLIVERIWISEDVREKRGDQRWLNLLLRKKEMS